MCNRFEFADDVNRDIKTLKELVNIAVDVKKNSIFNLREIVLEK